MLKRSLLLVGLVVLILSLSGLIGARLPPETVTRAFALPGPSIVYHVVRWGETLYSIALRYGVSVWAIAQANKIWNPNLIYAGQVLYIPIGVPTLTPSPTLTSTPPYTATPTTTGTPVPLATPTATCIPTPTATPTKTSSPTPTVPAPMPTRIIEVKYPPKMNIGDSYTIRLSLVSVKEEIYTPMVEIGYTVEVATPKPVGTPNVPLEKQFGEQYDVVAATAKITAIGFEYKAHDPESQPMMDKVHWRWGIEPKEPGKKEIILSLSLSWKPKLRELSEIKDKEIWSDTLWISVQEPLLTRGQINILGTLGSLVGPALTVPWLYDRWKERQEKKRAERSSTSG